MRKIISYLFAASTACTFAFRKMEESGVYKRLYQEEYAVNFISDIDQLDDEKFNILYEKLVVTGKEALFSYIYDPISKYGQYIIKTTDTVEEFPSKELWFQKVKHEFNYLRGNKFTTLEEALNCFGLPIRYPALLPYLQNSPEYTDTLNLNQFTINQLEPNLFFIDVSKDPETMMGIKHLIEKNKKNYNPLQKFRIIKKHRGYKGVKQEIRFTNTIEEVLITKTLENGQKKTLDFQKALNKYLEKQNLLGDSFAQPLVQLLTEAKIQETKITDPNNQQDSFQRSLAVEIVSKSNKLLLIEKQRELLKGCEILMIRCIIPDQEGTENNGAPLKCTIIGTAIDKKTLTTFHWVTELSKDLTEFEEDWIDLPG